MCRRSLFGSFVRFGCVIMFEVMIVILVRLKKLMVRWIVGNFNNKVV